MEKLYRIFKGMERYGVIFIISLMGLGMILSTNNLSGIYNYIEILCWFLSMLYIFISGIFGLYGMKYFKGGKLKKYLKYASYLFMTAASVFMFDALIKYIQMKNF